MKPGYIPADSKMHSLEKIQGINETVDRLTKKFQPVAAAILTNVYARRFMNKDPVAAAENLDNEVNALLRELHVSEEEIASLPVESIEEINADLVKSNSPDFALQMVTLWIDLGENEEERCKAGLNIQNDPKGSARDSFDLVASRYGLNQEEVSQAITALNNAFLPEAPKP